MEMTDQNTGDENVTRHLVPLTMYQLNSDAERDGNAQMCMCDLLNVYLSVTRADALERSHCLQLGLRVRVERSAPAQYARQGSCASNAGYIGSVQWIDCFTKEIWMIRSRIQLILGVENGTLSKYYIQN